MSKFKIKVYYTTGDSFQTYSTSDLVDLGWDNLETAEENLKAIDEHNLFYQEIESWRNPSSDSEIQEKYSGEWWFVDKKECDNFNHHCMKLKTDSGNLMQQWNPWCGYFDNFYLSLLI